MVINQRNYDENMGTNHNISIDLSAPFVTIRMKSRPANFCDDTDAIKE